jgi:hypothetical protein
VAETTVSEFHPTVDIAAAAVGTAVAVGTAAVAVAAAVDMAAAAGGKAVENPAADCSAAENLAGGRLAADSPAGDTAPEVGKSSGPSASLFNRVTLLVRGLFQEPIGAGAGRGFLRPPAVLAHWDDLRTRSCINQ